MHLFPRTAHSGRLRLVCGDVNALLSHVILADWVLGISSVYRTRLSPESTQFVVTLFCDRTVNPPDVCRSAGMDSPT